MPIFYVNLPCTCKISPPDRYAPAGALLDWCDVRGVDLEAFVVRKAAGDRVVLDDRTSLLGDVLGARALLECVAG